MDYKQERDICFVCLFSSVVVAADSQGIRDLLWKKHQNFSFLYWAASGIEVDTHNHALSNAAQTASESGSSVTHKNIIVKQ